MKREHSRLSSAGLLTGRPAPGCLVVVTAAELSVLDLLLTAVRRRMPGTTFAFPRRFATRRNGPAEAELPISRRLFRRIEEDGGFIAIWQAGGHRFGLPDSLRNQLLDGDRAVITAPPDVIANVSEIGGDVHTLRLVGGLDTARAALSPRACLRRIVGPRQAAQLETRCPDMRIEALAHDGDIRSAVRVLTEALVRIERAHRELPGCSAIRPEAEPRTGAAPFRCFPEATGAL